jgi:hypothetical protein
MIYGRRISSTLNNAQYEIPDKKSSPSSKSVITIDRTVEKGIPYWIKRTIDPEAEEQLSRYISWRYCLVEERFDFKMHACGNLLR